MNDEKVEKLREITRDRLGTLVIVLINLAVYIALSIIPGLEMKLLLNPDVSYIVEKPWTLVTVFFSHEILIHIAINMGLFFYFGSRLEKITNTKTVVLVYLIAGLMGSLTFPFTRLFMEQTELVAGASAAVMGVVSAFAVMRPNAVILKSKAMWWMLALIVFTILPTIMIPQTLDSGVAHLAGIMVGVLVGFCLKSRESGLQ